MESLKKGGFLIAKIHQLSQRTFAKILRKANLTELNPAQGRIMFVLWQEDNISIHEISKRTLLSKSTLTSMLDRLEQSGFIKRVPSRTDRREILIQLTNKHENFQAKYIEVSKDMAMIYYNNFTEIEINKFENYLGRILNNLIEYNKKKK
ncbi:MAG: MarR family winged helix-turn-helix transcriptional regulator [Candidatus Heimdallarchaeota archaeon]